MITPDTVESLLPHVIGRPRDARRLMEIIDSMPGVDDMQRERWAKKLQRIVSEADDDDRH